MHLIPPTNIAAYFIASIAFLVLAGALIKTNRFYQRPNTQAVNQYLGINGLRGFLALGVFFHHATINFFYQTSGVWQVPPSRLYTMLGQVGVAFFFIITGFLFWRKVLVSQGKVDWKQLYLSRIKRIYPMYLFSVAIIICFIIYRAQKNNINLLSTSESFIHTGREWLKYLTFGTPDIATKDLFAINAGVFWTLIWEWKFYIALPFLTIFINQPRKLLAAAIIFCYTSNEKFLWFFLAGMIAAELECKPSYRQWLKAKNQHHLFDLGFIAFMSALFALFDSAYGATQALLGLIAFVCLLNGNGLWGLLHLKTCQFLGEISYSIYLLHGIMLSIGIHFLPSNAFYEQFYWPITASIGALTIFASSLTHQWIEYRFYKK